MPLMGFEPTISVLERAKTVHALDRAATVLSIMQKHGAKKKCIENCIMKYHSVDTEVDGIYCTILSGWTLSEMECEDWKEVL
jgi:uncharacterized protein YaaN involved in tellurite resistance